MARKPSSTVELKGYGNSVNIIFSDDAAFSDVEKELIRKLENSGQFFAGLAVVLDLGDRVISNQECRKLKEILTDRFKLGISSVQCQSDVTRAIVEEIGWSVKNNSRTERSIRKRIRTKTPVSQANDTFLLKQTLRSGQKVWHSGNIVVVGDVNPGAEVVATGDIVIMGALRGMAHAGVDGNIAAKIIALNLYPIQLRIAEYIGRSPDLSLEADNVPEEARVEDGNITIRKLK